MKKLLQRKNLKINRNVKVIPPLLNQSVKGEFYAFERMLDINQRIVRSLHFSGI